MSASLPVFVISAPSGTGKTTLNNRLVTQHPDIEISLSLTTRAMRAKEVDGQDYHFVSRERFKQHVADGDMLEWAEVFGHLYGTSIKEIDRINKAGHTVILEIDVQGWQQAKKKLRKATSIFILPPSLEALWKRLESRGTDALDVRWRRLLTARDEIANGKFYDYFVVNDQLDAAYAELERIVVHGQPGRIDNAAGIKICENLVGEFEKSPWLKELRAKFAGGY